MEEALADLAELHPLLAEAQSTERRLSAFIGALERRFGGDGKS